MSASAALRTPLNVVLGLAQLMGLDQEAPLSADQQRRLALIRQSGEHLLAMIGDLRDLTSIEAGHLPLVLEAHDTGLGLSAAEGHQLFEPFNRLRHAQGPVEGTGIGLAVAHSLVRLMGGQIEVQSRPGQGSCFSVRLPMPAAPAPSPGPQGTSLP